MRDVVRHVPDPGRIEPGQCGREEVRRRQRVGLAQVIPRIAQAQIRGGPVQGRFVGVGDGIDVFGSDAAVQQAPGSCLIRRFPRREGHRPLAVLATAEPFLFGGGDGHTVDHQRRSWVVIYRVDPEYSHW